MKLKLKNTPEQVELIKAMGSRNGTESREALEAFAAFVGPVVQKVLNESALSSALYTDMAYDEDDSPSIPLDLYYNEDAGLISVWSQNVAGGMPTSTVDVPVQEMKFSTYRLDSAVSFNKKYARKSRLDVVSKAIERMTQEVLVKQERNAWSVVLKAVAEAATKNGKAASVGSTGSLRHIVQGGVDGNTAANFTLADLNKLVTRMKRVSQGFNGGTAAETRGVTDIFVSPEVKAAIRAFAYNPIFPTSGVAQSSVPNSVREDIYRGAGTEEIYGITINELLELGLNQRYNTLFANVWNNTAAPSGDTDGFYGTFSTNGDELIVAVDGTRDAFVRPVARQAESGGQFVVLPDDQFYAARQDKTGFYGFVEEGRVCLDARAVGGIILGTEAS
jgi:hypothetical protein